MDLSRVSTFGARNLAVWIIAATKGTSPSSIARIDGFRIDPTRAPLRVFAWDQIMPPVPDAWSNYWHVARSGREEPRCRMRLLASRVMASLPNFVHCLVVRQFRAARLGDALTAWHFAETGP